MLWQVTTTATNSFGAQRFYAGLNGLFGVKSYLHPKTKGSI
jgi:hypothetical protein